MKDNLANCGGLRVHVLSDSGGRRGDMARERFLRLLYARDSSTRFLNQQKKQRDFSYLLVI